MQSSSYFAGDRISKRCRMENRCSDTDYEPRCGEDGQTYFNLCFFDMFMCLNETQDMRSFPGVCRHDLGDTRTDGNVHEPMESYRTILCQ